MRILFPKVCDCSYGDIVEIVDSPATNPVLSGRFYRIGRPADGRYRARARFTQESVELYGGLSVNICTECFRSGLLDGFPFDDCEGAKLKQMTFAQQYGEKYAELVGSQSIAEFADYMEHDANADYDGFIEPAVRAYLNGTWGEAAAADVRVLTLIVAEALEGGAH